VQDRQPRLTGGVEASGSDTRQTVLRGQPGYSASTSRSSAIGGRSVARCAGAAGTSGRRRNRPANDSWIERSRFRPMPGTSARLPSYAAISSSARVSTDFASQLQTPVVLRQDTSGQGQPQTDSSRLGGEQRLHHVRATQSVKSQRASGGWSPGTRLASWTAPSSAQAAWPSRGRLNFCDKCAILLDRKDLSGRWVIFSHQARPLRRQRACCSHPFVPVGSNGTVT
jgi:hypothetical protein